MKIHNRMGELLLEVPAETLTGADLYGANLYGANLRGANLTGVDLRGADLRGANLRGANLCGADLTGVDLTGVDLRGADLTGVDLTGVDLRGADLRGACVKGGVLVGARPVFQLGPIGSREDRLIGFGTDNGVFLSTGCFYGTVGEFRTALARSHPGLYNSHADEYGLALQLIEKHFEIWK